MAQALLRLGTRASALARAQALQVQQALAALHHDVCVELVFIRTTGDRGVSGRPVAPRETFVGDVTDERVLERVLGLACDSGGNPRQDEVAVLELG